MGSKALAHAQAPYAHDTSLVHSPCSNSDSIAAAASLQKCAKAASCTLPQHTILIDQPSQLTCSNSDSIAAAASLQKCAQAASCTISCPYPNVQSYFNSKSTHLLKQSLHCCGGLAANAPPSRCLIRAQLGAAPRMAKRPGKAAQRAVVPHFPVHTKASS